MTPSLNSAPNEIILLIANAICENVQFEDFQICKFLAKLARVSRRFHDLVNPVLYSFDAKSVQSLALPWAIKRGNLKVLTMSVDGGVDLLSHIRSQKPFFRTSDKSIKILVDDEGRPTTDDVPSKDYIRKQLSDRGISDRKPEVELERWCDIARSNPQYMFDYDSELWHDDESDLDDDDCRSTTSRESFLGSWEATPLHLACFWGHKHIVKFLIEKDVDLNAPSRGVCSCMEVLNDGVDLIQDDFPAWTPLHTAICSSQPSDMKIAEMLLEAGADVETEAMLKETALHTAALQGRTSFINFLVKGSYQKNVDIKDGRDCTPLHYAYTRSNFCRTIPLLLKHGADINAHLLGHSALADACETSKYSDALTLLDLGADIPSAFDDGAEHGLLHSCFPRIPISGGYYHTDVKAEQNLLIDRILAQGKIDPNQQDSNGATPLMWAAKAHSISGVEKLLKAGARASILNNEGSNALIYACTPPSFFTPAFTKLEPMDAAEKWEMEAIEITQTLLNAGANLDHKDNRGRTAFHTLCEKGGYLTNLLVRFFMNNGADPTSRDRRGDSIFKSALLKGSLEICDILLRHPGGVKSVPQKDIESILTSVLSSWERPKWDKQFEYVLDLLMSPTIKAEEIFEKVVAAKKWGAVSIMLKRGLVPPAERVKVNPLCDLPPCRIERKDRDLVMNSLVKLGYNINGRNADGETPLYVAVGSDDMFLAGHILKLGAEVHAGEGTHRPINAAICLGRGDMVELLLKHTSLKQKEGVPQTYLHNALKKSNWFRGQLPLKDPIYFMLLNAGADPNYRDPEAGGDTPLMVFLKWVKDYSTPPIRESKRLADRVKGVLRSFATKHVDINVKNEAGKCAADCLGDLFGQIGNSGSPSRWLATYVKERVDLLDVGRGRKEMRIREEEVPTSHLGRSFGDMNYDEDDDDLDSDSGSCPCGHFPFG